MNNPKEIFDFFRNYFIAAAIFALAVKVFEFEPIVLGIDLSWPLAIFIIALALYLMYINTAWAFAKIKTKTGLDEEKWARGIMKLIKIVMEIVVIITSVPVLVLLVFLIWAMVSDELGNFAKDLVSSLVGNTPP